MGHTLVLVWFGDRHGARVKEAKGGGFSGGPWNKDRTAWVEVSHLALVPFLLSRFREKWKAFGNAGNTNTRKALQY